MSTIERMAGLLGSIEQQDATPSSTGKQDPIVRVVSENPERSGLRETRRFSSQLAAIEQSVEEIVGRHELTEPKVPTVPLDNSESLESKASPERPVITIDRARLRRQNIMTPDDARTPNAESFRRIKRHILANVTNPRAGMERNLVLVTSALPGEGKTFCAINLAISIALEMDRTVLLVDADVGKPSIPRTLGLQVERGLLDVLLDRHIDLADVLCKTDIGKLTLLSAGTPHHHATELLASEAMSVLLREMSERYKDRVIIFDSPPLLAASEAGVLASRMGQVVMVVEAGKTSEATLKTALARIESSNITGLLLNKGEVPAGDYYGAYG